MRRASARHSARRIVRKIVRRRRVIAGNDRRAVIARAKLHADRGEFLAERREKSAKLLPRGIAGHSRGLEIGRDADVADAFGQRARRPGVADRDRQPLGLIGVEQMRAAPALQHGGEFPGEIGRVVDPGIHAEAAGRREQMHGVAGEQHAPVGKALGHQRNAGGPRRMRDRLDRHLDAAAGGHGAPHQIVLRLGLRVFRPHPEQEFVLAVERDDGGADVRIDRPMLEAGAVLQHVAIERRRPQVACEHAPAEIGLLQRFFAAIANAEGASHERAAAVATNQIAGAPALFAAAIDRLRGERDAIGVLREIRHLEAEPQCDARAAARRFEQERLYIHLVGAQHRLGELIELFRCGNGARLLRGRGHGQPRQFVGVEAREISDVAGMLFRQSELAQIMGEAEAAIMLHGPRVLRRALRMPAGIGLAVEDDGADAVVIEHQRQREANRPAADDGDWNSARVRHVRRSRRACGTARKLCREADVDAVRDRAGGGGISVSAWSPHYRRAAGPAPVIVTCAGEGATIML